MCVCVCVCVCVCLCVCVYVSRSICGRLVLFISGSPWSGAESGSASVDWYLPPVFLLSCCPGNRPVHSYHQILLSLLPRSCGEFVNYLQEYKNSDNLRLGVCLYVFVSTLIVNYQQSTIGNY